jgi:hypothetical protein
MKDLRIQIRDEMYLELIDAATKCCAGAKRISPEQFAKDCIDSALASRRLERIPASAV